VTVHSSINALFHQQSVRSAEEKSLVVFLSCAARLLSSRRPTRGVVRETVTFPMSGAAPSNLALKLANGREVAQG